uniref:Uncharacterized protein n=2 Tax=Lotharella globosa TaxID=91324 RepID=A0A7S3ZCU3_9EUKA
MQSEINALSKISEDGEELSIAEQTVELKKLLTSMKETEDALFAMCIDGTGIDEEKLDKVSEDSHQNDTPTQSTTDTAEAKDCKTESIDNSNGSSASSEK